MSDQYIGEIKLFAGNFAPADWAFCNGQLVSISQNQALFAIVGTTYGGDGITTFGLPDLRGRVPVGLGQGPGLPNMNEGQIGGAVSATLLTSNLPSHTHNMQVNDNTTGTATTAVGGFLNSKTPSGESNVATGFSSAAALGANTLGLAGGNQPFSIVQPELGLNYIIALYGIFPSRN